jgi:hypothetical protein
MTHRFTSAALSELRDALLEHLKDLFRTFR